MAGELAVAYISLAPEFSGGSRKISEQLGGPATQAGKQSGQKAGQSFLTSFSSQLEAGGKKIQGVGDTLTKNISLPLLAAGTAAFGFSREFNKGMANVATLIPGNADRVAELKTGVQDLAVEMGKGTGDMTDGLYNVVSAFGDSSESMGILEINAKAATAGMAETTDAINLTSAVTKGYGDTSAQAVQQASDLALLTVRMGQTTFPELAGSIGAVVPIANSLNISQQELFATMATFTGVTGSASEVATQMRGTMQALMAPTSDAAAAIADAGFASGEAAVEALGMEGAIGILTDAADASGQPLQSYISSIEGQTLALGLAGAQAGDYETKLAEMADATGVTDAAFAEVTSGVDEAGFAFDQAKVRAQVMAQRLGDALAPALISVFDASEPLVEKVAELADWFTKLPQGTQTTILAFVGLVAIAGPALSIIGRMVTMTGMLVGGFAKATAGTFRFAQGLFVGKGALDAKSGAAARAGAALNTFVTAIGRAIAWLGHMAMAALRASLQVLLAAGRVVMAGVRMAVSMTVAAARVVAGWVLMGVQSLIQAARMAAAWLIAMGPVGWVIAAVIALAALIIANWDTIVAALAAAWQFITDLASTVWGAIVAFFTGIGEAIKGAFTAAWNFLVNLHTTVNTAIFSFLKGIWNAIAGFFKSIWEKLVAGVRTQVAAVLSVVGWFRDLPGKVKGWIQSVRDGAVEKFKSLVSWVKGLPGMILDALGDLGSKLLNAGKDLIQGFLNGIKDKFNDVKDTLGDLTSQLTSWKGPESLDRKILIGSGELVIGGFGKGLDRGIPKIKSKLQGLTAGLGMDVNSSITGPQMNLSDTDRDLMSGGLVATAEIDLGEGIRRVVDIKFERSNRDLKRRAMAGTGNSR